jgi:WD40 repeat protein
MQRFHKPIQRSAAHIYVSAIPLAPSSGILFNIYAPKLKNIPKLVSGDATSAPWKDIWPHKDKRSIVSLCSLDRSWLVFAGDNNQLEIWDVASGYPLRAPLTGHGVQIYDITFSHDGTKFCSKDRNGCILVWDATTYDAIGEPIQLPHSSHYYVSLWADNLITYDGRTRVSLWDIAAGISVSDHELGFVPSPFDRVCFQGPYLVVRKAKITHITYALTGESIIDRYTHGRDITDVIFSPDNKKVVCLYHTDNCVSILDVHSGNVVDDSIDVDVSDIWIASPNGHRIITLKGKHIAIYDLDTGMLVYGPFKTTYTAVGAELSLDETHLLVWDKQSFEVLDIPSGNVIASKMLEFTYL